MSPDTHDSNQVATRGRDYYENRLRTLLEREHRGRFVALDPDTGDFEIADDELAAIRGLRLRHAGIVPFVSRIGSPTTYRIGLRPTGSATP